MIPGIVELLPALLAALSGLALLRGEWLERGVVSFPVWFTRDGRNVHVLLARRVEALLRRADSAADRERVERLAEAGLFQDERSAWDGRG